MASVSCRPQLRQGIPGLGSNARLRGDVRRFVALAMRQPRWFRYAEGEPALLSLIDRCVGRACLGVAATLQAYGLGVPRGAQSMVWECRGVLKD